MSDITPTTDSKVTSTSVKITLNAKSLGLDAFFTLEETHEFINDAGVVDAAMKREEVAALLTEQLLALINDSKATVAAAVKTSAPVVVPQPAAATLAPAGTGAPAITAVANGAAHGNGWATTADRFDANKQVRFLTRAAFPSDNLKAACVAWIAAQGFNAELFDVWDERNDAEQGKPVSSVANIKVKKDFQALAPGAQAALATATGGSKAVARARFNADGSVWCYFAKEFEAAAKYGACDALKATAAAPVATYSEEEAF
jgi:hypothetical protein